MNRDSTIRIICGAAALLIAVFSLDAADLATTRLRDKVHSVYVSALAEGSQRGLGVAMPGGVFHGKENRFFRIGGRGLAPQQPHAWQMLWFRVEGVFLLVAAGSVGVWQQIRRKHLRKIAELKRSRELQAELAHVSRVSLLGELSASLAHELNQPLAAILTNAQAALRFLDADGGDTSEMRAILKDITTADRRASEIIGRMRAMVTKGEVQREAGDLNSDIEDVLLLIGSDLVRKNVTVTTELSLELPSVKGDHIQLQQVLMNLILNGCDAMSAKPPEARRLAVATAREGSHQARVSVSDRGTGIAPEIRERIFDAFYSTKAHGLGMGLAICQAIIKAHGGRLWAENNPDEGATFHFTVQIGERKPVTKPSAAKTVVTRNGGSAGYEHPTETSTPAGTLDR
jgi:signal transduction histidine kinase